MQSNSGLRRWLTILSLVIAVGAAAALVRWPAPTVSQQQDSPAGGDSIAFPDSGDAAAVEPDASKAVPEETGWGDLDGRFIFDGPDPGRQKLKVDKDVECCGKFDIRDESLMVGKTRGVANVYVYLRSGDAPVHPSLEAAAPKKVVLDNRDCIFKPHCLTIWTKAQELCIVNSDPVAQNVAFSPMGDASANIVLEVGKSANWKFGCAQRTPAPIACNYHPWEIAYVLPRENPYCAISDENGSFRIARLPVGNWEFQVWQERVGYLETPKWPGGRFRWTIVPGKNDLGTTSLTPSQLDPKAAGG